jgi:hypothetical protein
MVASQAVAGAVASRIERSFRLQQALIGLRQTLLEALQHGRNVCFDVLFGVQVDQRDLGRVEAGEGPLALGAGWR